MNKLIALSAFLVTLSVELIAQSDYPPLKTITFQPVEEKLLHGMSTEIASPWGCDNGILEEDVIGDIAVAAELYQNGCYTDGRYNHNDFKVVRGFLIDGNGQQLTEAYKVFEPGRKAAQFLGSQHKVYFKFSKKADYSIYEFLNGSISKLLDVKSQDISLDKYTKLEISASLVKTPKTIFVLEKGQELSVFHSLSIKVEGAKLLEDDVFQVYKNRFQIDGSITDTPTNFTAGPAAHANRYGDERHFFGAVTENEKVEVLWQEGETGQPMLTTLIPGKSEYSSIKMPFKKGRLAGATRHNGVWYYMIINTEGTKQGWFYSVKTNGQTKRVKQLNLSKNDGLNIHAFSEVESASMVYKDGVIGLIISRTMNKSSDGLNHQGAIAVTFDANTLDVIKNHGQTSGHSFDNFLYPSNDGGFIGMDLGDNYPRGINTHKIDDHTRSKLVYSFKTAHGTNSKSPAGASYPKYAEISGKETFYKWSNDNSTYTELGGLIEWEDSYDIYFVGEPDLNGRAINNARAVGYLNDARDIGYVKIKKDFHNQDDYILSEGIDEKGGFFTFGGWWSDLENKGIKWVQNYTDRDTENASRLKAIRMGEEVILLWEKWTPNDYVSTYLMKADKNGTPLTNPVELGSHVRISKSDDPLVFKDRVLFFNGNGPEGLLEVVEIALK